MHQTTYYNRRNVNGFFSNVATAVKNVATKVVTTVKEDAQAIANHPVKTIALAPVRLAFDGLLLLNFRGFASRLKTAIANNPTSVQSVAVDKLGYQWQNFVNTVNNGANKKPLLGTVSGTIGVVVAASVAADIAAAAPAITLIIQLLDALGLKEPQDVQTANTAIDQIQNAVQQATQPIMQTPITTSNGVIDTIKNNPVPTVIIGAGIAYGLMKYFKVIK